MNRNSALAVLACGVLAGVAQGQAYVDAFGDAVASFGAPPPLLDIDAIDISYDATSLYVSMTFHTPISPASFAQANSLFGFIDFDVDQNGATGAAPFQNTFSPPFAALPAGIEYQLDFGAESMFPGSAAVTQGFTLVGTVPVAFGPQSVSTVIPLIMLGGDDGLMDFTSIIGTFSQPNDASDSIGTSYIIPAPGAAMLLCVGLMAGGRRGR